MGIFTPHISTKRLAALTRALAQSEAAGVDIVRAIELHRAAKPGRRMTGVCADTADRLRSGHTLAQAFSSSAGAFPPDFIAALAAGDRAGRLAEVFQQFENLYTERMALRRALVRQIMYPICLVVAAFFIIPAWKAAMLSNEDLSTFAMQYAWSQRWDAVYIASAYAVAVMLVRLGIVRNFLAPALLYFWPAGTVLRKLALARAFQSVALLMKSGIPNAEAVALAAPACANRLLIYKFTRAVPKLSAGASFTEAVNAHVGIPALHLPVLQAAERSGTLETMLATVASELNREASHPILLLVSVLEMLLIAGIGLFFVPMLI